MTDKLVLPEGYVAVLKEPIVEITSAMCVKDFEKYEQARGRQHYVNLYQAGIFASPPCPVLTYAEVRRKVLEEAENAIRKERDTMEELRHKEGALLALLAVNALIDGEPT